MISRFYRHRSRTRVAPPAHVVAGLILVLLGALFSGPGLAPTPVDATEKIICDPGSYLYTDLKGDSYCTEADPGYYVATAGLTTQTPCGPGTYQDLAGQTSCKVAPAGTYAYGPLKSGTGATAATPCAPGSYQPLEGQIICLLADPGYYVDFSGAVAQTPCPVGSYQDLAGQTSCKLADPGYYVATEGATAQTPCPDGTTSAAGAVECHFGFTGFLAPIDNDATNAVKAGRSVPVKFGLGGDQGLDIFAAGAPSSQQIPCDSEQVVSIDTETTSAGTSSLTYDATSDQYTYVWKTDKAWADTCRQLDVTLTDGTTHTAIFQFK